MTSLKRAWPLDQYHEHELVRIVELRLQAVRSAELAALFLKGEYWKVARKILTKNVRESAIALHFNCLLDDAKLAA